MEHSRQYQERTQRSYRAPEIDVTAGLTYNRWGALGIVYGTNIPFISKLAKDIRDEEGNYLWSSPALVLTIAEASDAFRNDNSKHHAELMQAAVDYCNQYLPAESQLENDAALRLTWADNGLVSVTCENNRSRGYDMDVVKHGQHSFLLVAPRDPDRSPLQATSADSGLFVRLGNERPARVERPERNDRRAAEVDDGGPCNEDQRRQRGSYNRRRTGHIGS